MMIGAGLLAVAVLAGLSRRARDRGTARVGEVSPLMEGRITPYKPAPAAGHLPTPGRAQQVSGAFPDQRLMTPDHYPHRRRFSAVDSDLPELPMPQTGHIGQRVGMDRVVLGSRQLQVLPVSRGLLRIDRIDSIVGRN